VLRLVAERRSSEGERPTGEPRSGRDRIHERT
jgi:hypothetical protein